MKLTTKITIGIIGSIFLASLAFIIGLSFTDAKNYRGRSNVCEIKISKDNFTEIASGSFRAIIIEEIPCDTEDHYYLGNDCHLHISPVLKKGNENSIFVPEEIKEFVSTYIKNDTLIFKVDLRGFAGKYKSENIEFYPISGINIHFNMTNIHLTNKIQDLAININKIEADSVMVVSSGSIYIDSCRTNVLAPVMETYHRELIIKHCEAKKFFLDLDQQHHWIVENCTIGESFYTSSNRHNIMRYRNETGRINWLPKNKDARLNIELQGDTTQIIFL